MNFELWLNISHMYAVVMLFETLSINKPAKNIENCKKLSISDIPFPNEYLI